MRPRRATPRDPDLPTDAELGAFIAYCHGRPWLPWQHLAAEVAGEQTPDGRYRYRVVIVLVPRQCGKTSFAFDLAIGRCAAYRDYRAAYAAQTGHVTTERFQERIAELAGTPLRRIAKGRRSAGTERITITNGSFLKAFPPRDGALRSSTLDLVIVDEAQEHGEELGLALDRTINPTMTTRPRRQLIIIGTAGTAHSAYLRRYLDRAEAGEPGVAVVEYGFSPDADPTDESEWIRTHPGLAYGLTDLDALRGMYGDLGPAGFMREFGNVWTTGRTVSAINPDAWTTQGTELVGLAGPPAALAFDVDHDRGTTTIAAAEFRVPPGDDETPAIHVRVIEQRPGTSWAEDQLVEYAARWPGVPVYFDGLGPGVDVGMALATRRGLGKIMRPLQSPDVAAACIGFASAANGGTVWHYRQAPLSTSLAAAERKTLGDRWIWDRAGSPIGISPTFAATLAYHGAVINPPRRKPVVRG